MRIKYLFLSVIFTLILAPISKVSASAQDFYFEDFTADYYLTKLEDGTSNLHVREVLTAVFPYTDQNHGITRSIPFTNQDGKNRTIANQNALNLKVLRNGKPENVNKIETESDYYNVYIGDADEYVHGKQIYTLEYDYTDVITEFGEDGLNVSGEEGVIKVFQELYWDTNGTEWKQSFGSLTANVHMPEEILKNVKLDDTACYVGSYGKNGKSRCTIVQTEDGFSFSTYDLDKKENLTFAIDFEPGTFKVVLEKSYVLVIILAVELLVVILIIVWRYSKWKKTAKLQYDLYKATFVAPQYQPPVDKNIKVAEGEQIYLKKTKPSYVATLLELAVSKAVEIKKVENEKKYDWSVLVKDDPEKLSGSQKEMLKILAGGGNVKKGDEIPIEKHVATKHLADCARAYGQDACDVLEEGGYLDDGRYKKANGSNVANIVLWTSLSLIFLPVMVPIVIEIVTAAVYSILPSANTVLVGLWFIPWIMFVTLVAVFVALIIINGRINKYSRYTESGIKLAKYLEGLELYIKMAEADRLKFLQSVEGADTSNTGIIKLYEKLLPWAILFGAEESWVKELSKYYEIEDVGAVIDSDVLDGIIAADIIRSVNSTVSASTSYHESSGGGGSSGFSGGGGGGFSGGGGGGGGGGGW